MRVVVMSDVHANVVALEAVLAHAGPADAYWFLGDAVGYGPEPNIVVERLRALPNGLCLLGNHDAAVIGRLPLSWFHEDAQQALRWTQQALSAENRAFLQSLSPRVELDTVVLAHGSPREPLEEYLISDEAARANFRVLTRPYAFVGHSHIPLAWVQDDRGDVDLVRPGDDAYGQPFALPRRGVILNPGSVGQPRDGDPRAAYAIYDPDVGTWTWHRVPYDIEEAIRRFERVPALPARFARRLREGR
ncbi:MAG: metallophosphoesterase family protein [Chloroflexi bacterium]|nr:metallophosphoesterase family protein [Chloroflexota bacterium]